MKRIFFIGFLLVQTSLGFCSCRHDPRSLTERLFGSDPGIIFSGKILSTNQEVGGEYYSTVEITELFFGNVDSNIVRINTGNPMSSVGGGPYPIGVNYLIYAAGNGKLFYCGTSCDKWTKQISETPVIQNEIEILRQFSKIIKQKKSGQYKFFFADGTLAAKGSFKRGKPSGTWKHYYSNGNLKSVYDIAKKITVDYSEKGILLTKQERKRNGLVYYQYSKDTNEVLVYKVIEQYTDTTTTMTVYEYYPDGNLKNRHSQINVKSGKGSHSTGKTGIYEDYYPNGKLSLKGKYLLGKQIGVWTWYKENGEIDKEVDFDK